MTSRSRWAAIAVLAMLAVASPCLAADADTTAKATDSSRKGSATGRGGVGGLLGGSWFYASQDYSLGALPRFDLSGQFRYQMSPRWRLQIGPGFTWSSYSKNEPPPLVDVRFPLDRTKEEYLTQLVPVSAQVQYTWGRAPWMYHLGGGPGVYRILVQNHRKDLKDPTTFRVHRGLYLGGTAEAGIERFFKALPNTSVEMSLASHWVLATRDDQFPAGFNSSLGAMALRLGANYYFDMARLKPKEGLPKRTAAKGGK